MKNDIKKRR